MSAKLRTSPSAKILNIDRLPRGMKQLTGRCGAPGWDGLAESSENGEREEDGELHLWRTTGWRMKSKGTWIVLGERL